MGGEKRVLLGVSSNTGPMMPYWSPPAPRLIVRAAVINSSGTSTTDRVRPGVTAPSLIVIKTPAGMASLTSEYAAVIVQVVAFVVLNAAD